MNIRSVDILVPSWNGREHLATCLPELLAQHAPGLSVRVLVFDNGSTDGSEAWLRREFPAVQVVRSEHNLGFCRANNLLAQRSTADALVLLNNDTRPAAHWLMALVEVLASAPPDVAAVSGQIVDWDGERLDFARGVMTFDGHGFQLGYHQPLGSVDLPATGSELLFACGGNAILRRAAFLRAGGFDEGFFAYLEDVDLGWRLWAGGERVLFAREAIVHHRSMATSDLLGVWKRGFLFERNAWLTVYKNYDPEHFAGLMPLVLLVLLARTQALLGSEANPGAATELTGGEREGGVTPRSAGPRRGFAELLRRARALGPQQVLARMLTAAGARVAGAPDTPPRREVRLQDQRALMQLRAVSAILGALDAEAPVRARLQQRRRRSDREIFERFPLYLVPTYPGDEELFAGAGFASLVPAGVPMVRARLAEIMAL